MHYKALRHYLLNTIDIESPNPPRRRVGVQLLVVVPYRTTNDRFDLPDFSFLKLRHLGCTDPTVLAKARAFDDEG